MKRDILKIDKDGKVTIPANVQMTDFEIADFFSVFVSKIKANIRSLLKSKICPGDNSNGGVVIGNTIYPQYYGFEIIIALSFRVDSANARVFKEWMLKRIISNNMQRYLSHCLNHIFHIKTEVAGVLPLATSVLIPTPCDGDALTAQS